MEIVVGIVVALIVFTVCVCYEPYFDHSVPGFALQKRQWLIDDIASRKEAAERERIKDEAFTRALMRNAERT